MMADRPRAARRPGPDATPSPATASLPTGDLILLARLADVVATDLLGRYAPADWTTCTVVGQLVEVDRHLHAAGRAPPASLAEALGRAEASRNGAPSAVDRVAATRRESFADR